MSRFRTLGDLMPRPEDPIGDRLLHAQCDKRHCGHMHRFDIRKLIERYGRHCPLRDFEWRLVCSKCGAREAWVRLVVTWKPRNMAEMNANLATERRYQRQERARR